ncbi:chitobiase/beta-hexosaminidase C-terminal domain-containing protein [Pelotomaculum isophthalicicum JI]|uniref:Chitobiase/beta-hexosaminidase C-terminal domain-containing protein n=1 Tax=Pelotomaculum isophthalicicum JI TaxID=947010 RepID=A0A9X4H1T1_9FIRM|nr:FN3 associated domain-containing protein [Pelotomaculum isophthalicicum]MDF9406768.1 chitobiase/beta-hexosaminidase C-terminal domain-containing protein [Pelotomaculum isophthalicicum JI]
MIRVKKQHYRVFALLMVLSLLFSSAASAAVPATPGISPTPGTYSGSVTVSVYNPEGPDYNTVGAKVYYTTNGDNPITEGTLYTAPVVLSSNATVKAVAYNDDGYSDIGTASYTVTAKTVLERLNDLSPVLDKFYKLSPEQMSSVVEIVYNELGILWTEVLSDSEKANLARKGITEDALKGVVNAFKSYVNDSVHSSGGASGYEGFKNAIQPVPNRDFNYLGAYGPGLYQCIRGSFPLSFRDNLLAMGTSVEDLIDTIISLADLNLVAGLTLTPELKAQAKSIFETKIVNTSNITLQMLINNGLTFENAQQLIDKLSDPDKYILRAAIWTMGYLGSPKANPAPGNYPGPVTVSLSSDTPGAKIFYTLNETPWSVNVATYLSEGSLNLTSTTTVHAAAYADGVYTEPVDFTYTIAAPVTLSSISLDSASYSLNIGGTHNTVVTATYSDSSSADVTAAASYSSGNTNVATVNASGVVTAVGAGDTVITATYGGKSATASVTVNAAPVTLSSISLDSASYSLNIGGTHNTVVTATYSDSSSADVTAAASYSSGNTNVATVNASGVVTAVGAGDTVITATYGGKTATATVTVSAGGGTVKGSVVPQGLSAGKFAGINVILLNGSQQVSSVSTLADGSYQMDNVPEGNYTVMIESPKYLSSKISSVAVSVGSTVNLSPVTLLVGDANSDDMIGGLDFSALLSAWNKSEGQSGYNPLNDFNGDKTIGGLDFSLLLQNWNKKGVTVP